MPKAQVLEQKDFARNALIEATSKSKVGNFIEVIEEGEGLATTFLRIPKRLCGLALVNHNFPT